ncbi:von Willebrand factor type A domain protein [Planctomycetes bacterium Pla163]|uniref:von Willebrand factor type A domain protein n=1 Tax=Rohdeia mirabilis TaxID=2528008 RepID=A0A518D370_9BACT|nr:von Willebrand factor type A domain protein [Planctomycetes bacterium Pla163]
MIRHLALVGLASFLVAAPSPLAHSSNSLAAPAATCVATTVDDVEELVGRIRLMGDRVSIETLTELAKIGTPDALAGFALALDGGVLKREIARARTIRALSGFMKSKDLSGRVREMLANLAANADNSLEGIAAIETLGASGGIAREWLVKVVESPAMAAVRVRALELHAEEFDIDEDERWYTELYKAFADSIADLDPNAVAAAEANPTRGKPLAGVGGLAFEKLAPKLDEAELRSSLDSRNRRVRTAAMVELADRGDRSMLDRARGTFLNPAYGPSERAECAIAWGSAKGWEEVLEEVQRSLANPAPQGGRGPTTGSEGHQFTSFLADLLSKRGSESFADAAVKHGPGLVVPAARAFCARAIGRTPSSSAEKFLREMIEDEDLMVRVEALRTLALRGTEGARKLLDRALKKAATETEEALLVELTSELYGGDPEWVEDLVGWSKEEPSQKKNAALVSLARIGGAYEDLFSAALGPEVPWGTQRAAVEALLLSRSHESTAALVASLERLDGRIAKLVMDALEELTGERFRNPGVWPRWWKDNASGFVPLSEKEYTDLLAKREQAAEEAAESGENNTVAGSFFGVELDSERLTFVIDASGSMAEPMAPRTGGPRGPTTGGDGEKDRKPRGGTRLEVAQNELNYFLKELPESALVNVVRFSNGAKAWSDRLKSVGKKKTLTAIQAFVERLSPDGGTNVYEALQVAFEDPDVDTIMLLSDGAPSVGEVLDTGTIADHVALWNAHRGVTIHVVCIGGDQPELRRMAETSGGSYTLIR